MLPPPNVVIVLQRTSAFEQYIGEPPNDTSRLLLKYAIVFPDELLIFIPDALVVIVRLTSSIVKLPLHWIQELQHQARFQHIK